MAGAVPFVWLGCAALLAVPAHAQERLQFDDQSALSIDVADDGTATTKVVVLNNGSEVPVTFSVVPTGDSAAAITVNATPSSLRAFGATSVTLSFTQIPPGMMIVGDLVVSSAEVGVAVRPISLAPKSTGPNYIRLLTLLSLAAAAVFTLVRLALLQHDDGTKFDGRTRLGKADWKFSESWASNLTAGSALLGMIVAGSVLPDHPHLLTKAQYGALNLYFGVLVVVAAFLYNAVVAKKEVPGTPALPGTPGTPATPATYQAEGFVWMYLVASMLTLWAVWGELGTLYVMMTDVVASGSFASLSSRLLLAGSAVVVVAGGFYAWVTIEWNVYYYREQPTNPPPPGLAVPKQITRDRATRPQPLQRISVL